MFFVPVNYLQKEKNPEQFLLHFIGDFSQKKAFLAQLHRAVIEFGHQSCLLSLASFLT
jgi:hypothetical protein